MKWNRAERSSYVIAERMVRGKRPWERGESLEIRVWLGRKIIARCDTRAQAERRIAEFMAAAAAEGVSECRAS